MSNTVNSRLADTPLLWTPAITDYVPRVSAIIIITRLYCSSYFMYHPRPCPRLTHSIASLNLPSFTSRYYFELPVVICNKKYLHCFITIFNLKHCTLFYFCKNLFYKNIKVEIGEIFKTMLRLYPKLRFS